MDMALPILLLAIGVVLGGGVVWFALRGREQTATATLRAVLQERDGQLAEAKAALEREESRVDAADEKTEAVRRELADAKAVEAALRSDLKAEREGGAEKLRLLNEAKQVFADAFKALSSEALHKNNESFLKLAGENLSKQQAASQASLEQKEKAVEGLVKPIREKLAEVDTRLQTINTAWAKDHGGLNEQIKLLSDLLAQQKTETGNLVQALRTPQVRGRWGEEQLRNVVQIAGMIEYCDFVEQESARTEDGLLRPDMIVRLPNGQQVVVDAKAPAAAYFESLNAKDEAARDALLQRHGDQVWSHVEKLSAKSYWDQFQPAPEFVVMFLPGEMLFRVALERSQDLMNEAMRRKVIIASPFTLLAVLKAVSYGWRQESLSRDLQKVADLGKEMYDRIRVVMGHMDALGGHIGNAVDAYNRVVTSVESRLDKTAQRFVELKVVQIADDREQVEDSESIDKRPRSIPQELRKASKE